MQVRDSIDPSPTGYKTLVEKLCYDDLGRTCYCYLLLQKGEEVVGRGSLGENGVINEVPLGLDHFGLRVHGDRNGVSVLDSFCLRMNETGEGKEKDEGRVK